METDSLNYESVENEKPVFKSDLGDYTHLQDRLIRFGRSKDMIILGVLILSGFLITIISLGIFMGTDLTFTADGETTSFNWLKIIIVLVLGIVSIIPVATSYILYGGKKKSVLHILKGVKILDMYITLMYVVLIIGAIIIGFTFLLLMFKAFIIVVLLGAIVFAMFYIYFKFLGLVRTFIGTLHYSLTSHDVKGYAYPRATSFKNYLIALLIFSIISWFANLGNDTSTIGDLNSTVGIALESMNTFSTISSLLGIISLGYTIYLTGKFDVFIRRGLPRNEANTFNTNTLRPKSSFTNSTEDNWRL